jgi:hypothetical protein
MSKSKYDYEPLWDKIFRLGIDMVIITLVFVLSLVVIYLT